MDAYPSDYVQHNLPLVYLSGLSPPSSDNDVSAGTGPLVDAKLPLVQSDLREELLQDFLSLQGSSQTWSGRASKNKNDLIGYKFKSLGRSFRFPPRKADPPSSKHLEPQSPQVEEKPKIPAQWVLHSPLSPLSPDSPLYPDGLFTPLWMAKHNDNIPCMLIAFFNFTSDANLNSLNDNQLKSEINGIRAALSDSGYKTRLAVVLLSDKTIIEAPDIEDRLANIRRTTGLDPKSGLFFLPPNTSRVEITSFATTVMSTLQNLCIDYYRDLTKHARRKKNRGNAPQPTVPPTKATSHPLTNVGWSIRYDVKMGVFAEFRQEMDVACRNYTSALESLMGSEGVFETTHSWSPRWNEGRKLSDVLALRIIRSLLWHNMTTTAALSWVNYRDRMREMIDRRGKGTSNYGWEAWESRWAKIMAELVQRAELPSLSIGDSIDMTASMVLAGKSENTTYLPADKGVPSADLLAPWSLLHHPGYWMRLSVRNAKRRRRYALEIPEEDRTPPGETPASSMANRSSTYDLYLSPEPHIEFPGSSGESFDHGRDIVERLNQSTRFFLERNQSRFASRLRLEAGRELLRMGKYKEAVDVLQSIWEMENCSWRREKWLFPLFNLDRILYESAKNAGDVGMVVSTVFELYHSSMLILRDMKVDLMNCAKSVAVKDSESAQVKLSPDQVMSFINTSFLFAQDEGNVGNPISAQLFVYSNSHENSAPVIFSRIKGTFKQDRFAFEITHDDDVEESSSLNGINMQSLKSLSSTTKDDGKYIFTAKSNLKFIHGQKSVWDFDFDMKDSGDLILESLNFEISTAGYDFSFVVSPDHFTSPHIWYIQESPESLVERKIYRSTPWFSDVKPKPPKLEVTIADLKRALYTDEPVRITFHIENGEDEEVSSASLDIRILSRDTPPAISWIMNGANEPEPESTNRTLNIASTSPGQAISHIAAFTAPIKPANLILEARLHYYLPSDPEIPLSKTFSTELVVQSPFEANYDFGARVHPDPWQSYFSTGTSMPGLLQRWSISASVASFALQPLTVDSVSFEIEKRSSGLSCNLVQSSVKDGTEILPKTMRNYDFQLDTVRPTSSVKHDRTLSFTGNLKVAWRYQTGNAPAVTSTIPVSPFVLSPLEPRVVASAKHATLDDKTPLTLLNLFLENPSAHPLTFDITTPSSEALAFSGPKQLAVTILPYSRTKVDYRVLPLISPGVWVDMLIKVVDRYFVREVDVLPGEGLREGENGALRWWIE